VTATIVFTVDRGEEFGGSSWLKVKELRKLIAGFGCRLKKNRSGHPEDNAHLERSHRTDDDELDIPRVFKIKSEEDLLMEGMRYIYFYNNIREHSSLDDKSPYEYLKAEMPEINDKIRYVIPIMLDKVSVELGPWSGYHVLAQHLYSLGYNDPERFIGRWNNRLFERIKAVWTYTLEAVKMNLTRKRFFSQIKEVASYGDYYLKVLSYSQKGDFSRTRPAESFRKPFTLL
jgi:hypothetical protein